MARKDDVAPEHTHFDSNGDPIEPMDEDRTENSADSDNDRESEHEHDASQEKELDRIKKRASPLAADIATALALVNLQASKNSVSPADNEIQKQSVHAPRTNVEAESQLAEPVFGDFLTFFIRVQTLLAGKSWSPDVEGWVLQQFKPDSNASHTIRDTLGKSSSTPTPDKDKGTVFSSLEQFRGWCFETLFHDSLPQDVVEKYMKRLRVGRGTDSHLAKDCTHLAHLAHEALSYLPTSFGITKTEVVSRVKAILPEYASGMLEAHELGRAQEGPIQKWDDLLRFVRTCDKSFHPATKRYNAIIARNLVMQLKIAINCSTRIRIRIYRTLISP